MTEIRLEADRRSVALDVTHSILRDIEDLWSIAGGEIVLLTVISI